MLSTLNNPTKSSPTNAQKIDYFRGPNQSKAQMSTASPQFLYNPIIASPQSQEPQISSPYSLSPDKNDHHPIIPQNSEDFFYNSKNSFLHAPNNAFEYNYIQEIPQFPSQTNQINPKDLSNDNSILPIPRPFGPKYTPKPQPEPIQDITKVVSILTNEFHRGSTHGLSHFSQLGSEKPQPDEHVYIRKNADINDSADEEEGEGDGEADDNDKDDDEEDSHLPFNLKRANMTQLFSYEEDSENDPAGVDEPKSRISFIESTFRSNAYYHDLDHDFEEREENQIPPDEEEIKQNRHRLSSRVFKSSDQLGKNYSHFKSLLDQLKNSHEKFVDDEFPPNLKSLAGNNQVREAAWGECIWLRPGEFYRNGYEIFKGIIEPNDIKQGQLGDCYFLSTLASIAEWPNRIMKIFETIQVNPYGCYCVKICDMGEWKEVIVDDFFPCDKVTRKPIFTIGNDNELWVLILEKVWAKIYGSYDAIERGLTRECLHDFTGAPTKFFLTDRKEEWGMIWKKLVKAKSKKYALTCGAKNFFNKENVSSKGIVGLHAYSLLGAYHVKIKHRWMKVKLVKLRNPWGKTEWKGDWSDSSPKWTPHLRRKLKVQDKEDGIFFMAYEDFLRYFTDIQFCYIHDNYHYNSFKVTSDTHHAVYFKITIKTEGKYYITVNQESRRHSQNKNFKYSTVSMVLAQIQPKDRYEYCTGNYRADREVWVKGYLVPGEYLVYAKVQWAAEDSNQFVLSTYGPGKATTIEMVSKTHYPRFLEKSFMTKARFMDKKVSYAREGEATCFSVVSMSIDGFIYCYYHNDSARAMDIEVLFKVLKGIKLRKPYSGNSFKLSILPGKKQIVLLRILPGQDVKQVLSEKVKFKTVNSTLSPEVPSNQGKYSTTGKSSESQKVISRK